MYNFFQKKSPKPKVAIQRHHAPQTSERFIPMLLGGFLFFWLLMVTVHAAPQVGSFLEFEGSMPPPSAGYTVINATIVHDAWGGNGKTCRMNMKAMMLAKGIAEVEAVNSRQVILQWHENKIISNIGCPSAPALLAVNLNDYQHMVSWEKSAMKPYFRG